MQPSKRAWILVKLFYQICYPQDEGKSNVEVKTNRDGKKSALGHTDDEGSSLIFLNVWFTEY